MTHLLGLTLDELTAQFTALGLPKFRAAQVLDWVYAKRTADFAAMTNLALADRTLLAQHYQVVTSALLRQQHATDGTDKILLAWPADTPPEAETPAAPLTTETVLIPADDDQCDDYGHTTVAHRRTVCLSTQVGCPVGCRFCASGLEGFQQNLTSGQIIEQAWRLAAALPPERRLTNVVFMGMGEPLANYAATLAAVRILMAPWAFHVSGRKITISTVGLPPQIKRLAEEGLPVTLALSLHAPNDELRAKIIPWAGKIPLADILAAARYYFEKTGRELTLEYILLAGVNTLPEHARQLAAIATSLRANVNLIYYNEVPGLPFQRPTGQAVLAFQTALRNARVNAHVRQSRGRDIAAACGQLARQTRLTVSAEPQG